MSKHTLGEVVKSKDKPTEVLSAGLIWRKARGKVGEWVVVKAPGKGGGKRKGGGEVDEDRPKATLKDLSSLSDTSLATLAETLEAERIKRTAEREAEEADWSKVTKALDKSGIPAERTRYLLNRNLWKWVESKAPKAESKAPEAKAKG